MKQLKMFPWRLTLLVVLAFGLSSIQSCDNRNLANNSVAVAKKIMIAAKEFHRKMEWRIQEEDR